MKRILLWFVVSSFFVQACTVNKNPEFVQISNIAVMDYNPKSITLSADLDFLNPNHLGGTLQLTDIHVLINNMDMGTITSGDFKVPAQDEFTVPMRFEFPYENIFQDKENILNNILNTLTNKKIDVHYKGNITYKLNLFSYDYPLDYSQEILLKKNR